MKKYHKYYENTKNHGSAILMGLGLWVAIPLNFPALLTLLVVLRPMVIGTYYVLWGISFIIRKFRPSFPVVDHNFYIQLLEDCEKAEKNLRKFIKWLLQCLVYYAGYFWWLIEKASRRITVFFTNHQKNKPLILLPISDQTSIYTRLFSFLGLSPLTPTASSTFLYEWSTPQKTDWTMRNFPTSSLCEQSMPSSMQKSFLLLMLPTGQKIRSIFQMSVKTLSSAVWWYT